MNKLKDLNFITKVKPNNRVNILLELNDNFTLLVEGSFSVEFGNNKTIGSREYFDSNFSAEIFTKIQGALVDKPIKTAIYSEQNGALSMELGEGVRFNIFQAEEDYDMWELSDENGVILSAECGSVIHY